MSCTQKQQLVCFPKVRVYKPWFRHFNDHKDFRNEGTVHLFSLMALFSYANFRSNERVINGDRYMEAPGQWICKLGALPRILRVHSKAQALELMEYFQDHGFLTFEILDEEKEILRFTIADWKEHCTHLQYNYYSYKGSGFFFFPLPVGRLLLKTARKEVGIVFSELDAIMDMWLHTTLNDPKVRGSEYMPVVYYSNMRGVPLLSYTYLAKRWGWSKSRVGRFMLKAGEYGIISRVSFSSSRGSVISMCRMDVSNKYGYNNMAIGMYAGNSGNALYCPTGYLELLCLQDRFVYLPELPYRKVDLDKAARNVLTQEQFEQDGGDGTVASWRNTVTVENVHPNTTVSFRMNNLSGDTAGLKLYAYGADGKLAEVGKELWSITDETGAAVDTLSDGTLYELRVSVADGDAFDLSEAEKEIKISVALAK